MLSHEKIMPMKSEQYNPNSNYLRNAVIVDGFYDTITLPMKEDLKGHEYSLLRNTATI